MILYQIVIAIQKVKKVNMIMLLILNFYLIIIIVVVVMKEKKIIIINKNQNISKISFGIELEHSLISLEIIYFIDKCSDKKII